MDAEEDQPAAAAAHVAGELPGPPGGQAVGFLLSQFGLVIARQFREVLAPTGLEPREFALLRVIAAAEGSTQNALSDLLSIPASSLVSVIDRLEANGLVARRTHPDDRRARTLHLTDAGRDVLSVAAGLAMGYEQHICGNLTAAERLELLSMLDRVGERLQVTRGIHPDMAEPASAPSWTTDPSV